MTLILALLLSGCGKKVEEGSGTEVEMSYSNYEMLLSNEPSALPPTIVLIAENSNGIKLVKSIQENFNFNFPNGVWKFYIMSWNWATPSNGGAPYRLDNIANNSSVLFCGFQNAINLTGQPTTIQMSLSSQNCDNPSYNQTVDRYWFKYNGTPPAKQYYAIFSVVSFNVLNGTSEGEIFRSNCKVFNSDAALSPELPMPKIDVPLNFKVRLVVRIYDSVNCIASDLKYSLIYSNTLRSNPIKIRHTDNPDPISIYLKAANETNFQGETITLDSATPTFNPNISNAEADTDNAVN